MSNVESPQSPPAVRRVKETRCLTEEFRPLGASTAPRDTAGFPPNVGASSGFGEGPEGRYRRRSHVAFLTGGVGSGPQAGALEAGGAARQFRAEHNLEQIHQPGPGFRGQPKALLLMLGRHGQGG